MTLQSFEAIAGGLALVTLVVAGIALTVYGLRSDLRARRRGYRRRGPRPPGAGRPNEVVKR